MDLECIHIVVMQQSIFTLSVSSRLLRRHHEADVALPKMYFRKALAPLLVSLDLLGTIYEGVSFFITRRDPIYLRYACIYFQKAD